MFNSCHNIERIKSKGERSIQDIDSNILMSLKTLWLEKTNSDGENVSWVVKDVKLFLHVLLDRLNERVILYRTTGNTKKEEKAEIKLREIREYIDLEMSGFTKDNEEIPQFVLQAIVGKIAAHIDSELDPNIRLYLLQSGQTETTGNNMSHL